VCIGPRPFGYVRTASGRLIPDQIEGPLVTELFRRRADGARIDFRDVKYSSLAGSRVQDLIRARRRSNESEMHFKKMRPRTRCCTRPSVAKAVAARTEVNATFGSGIGESAPDRAEALRRTEAETQIRRPGAAVLEGIPVPARIPFDRPDIAV
jgi:hypothetical protein